MTLTPSYQQGFAPRDYEPLYPQLWSGCVGAWAPCLGATGTVLRDHSGYGNHGALQNMDPPNDWVISGGKGALDFDGSNDYIAIGNKSALDFKDNDCSIVFWSFVNVFAGVQVNNPQIVYKGNGTSGYDARAFSYLGVNYIQCNFAVSGTQNDTNIAQLSTNVWYHCAFVVSGSKRFAYKNALITDERSHTKGTIASETYNFSIGSNGPGTAGFFTGQLDDIRIYNRALSEQEIRLLASERGIAYKQRRKRRFSQQAATGSRRLKLLTGLP